MLRKHNPGCPCCEKTCLPGGGVCMGPGCIPHDDPTTHDVLATLGENIIPHPVAGCAVCNDLNGAEYTLVWNGFNAWAYNEPNWCVGRENVELEILFFLYCDPPTGNCHPVMYLTVRWQEGEQACASTLIYGAVVTRKQTRWDMRSTVGFIDPHIDCDWQPCKEGGDSAATAALIL